MKKKKQNKNNCIFSFLGVNHRCTDPCAIGICGTDADCHVVNHKPLCECPENHSGDPYVECILNDMDANQTIDFMPCDPNPCTGIQNAMCIEQNGMGTCICAATYFGDPEKESGCIPKCKEHADCPLNRACMQNECRDPCDGVCPGNADCHIMANRMATCMCKAGHTGDAYRNCTKIEQKCKF